MKYDVIVIGGGAAGIAAAITAKDAGCNVAILESTDRIGKKILTTGNGRCNISNEKADVTRYHSDNKDFFKDIISNFSYKDTMDFFASLGLHLKTLDSNKMYPLSLQASSVVDIFRMALEDKSIDIYFNSKVNKIENKNNVFKLHINEGIFTCTKLILCTGGKSYPKTGSDGSGYKLATSLGHKITNLMPSIVQVRLNHDRLKALSGVKFDGVAKILVNDKLVQTEEGEILFTDYGISGPPILQLSRVASYSTLSKKNKVSLQVDLMPNMDEKALKTFIDNHLGTFGYRSIHDCFIGLINKKIIVPLLREAEVDDIHKAAWEVTWEEKCNVLKLLKSWTFEVTGTNTFNDAQVTAGGINTKDIDPITLESKLVKNLYFAGEVLDVDGDCGGFNLHWCWASGIRVGKSVCNHLNLM